jgi:phosphoribosyl-dephospho-CoA transferase
MRKHSMRLGASQSRTDIGFCASGFRRPARECASRRSLASDGAPRAARRLLQCQPAAKVSQRESRHRLSALAGGVVEQAVDISDIGAY